VEGAGHGVSATLTVHASALVTAGGVTRRYTEIGFWSLATRRGGLTRVASANTIPRGNERRHPMLKPITVRTHTGPDGSLRIAVPTSVRETDVEVVLVIRPVPADGGSGERASGWPDGFLERMYGSLADVGLKRHPQGDCETRDPIP
jgi:hypothetical protein